MPKKFQQLVEFTEYFCEFILVFNFPHFHFVHIDFIVL